MNIEIKVPQAGESVTEAMISQWFKKDGDTVEKDEPLLELETDKANMELNADEAGVLRVLAAEGDVVKVGQVIATIATGAQAESIAAPTLAAEMKETVAEVPSSPSARRIIAEQAIDPVSISGSGRDGRINKEDAQAAADKAKPATAPIAPPAITPAMVIKPAAAVESAQPAQVNTVGSRSERVVSMSMMRRRIAQRLVEAQHTAAILTTFNDVDMSAVMDARNRFKDAFEKKHKVKLGFMSFFVKASIEALRHVPEINASIDGTNIIYRDYCDIGVAVGTDKGLVVPVIRNAETLSFAGIEKTIANYGAKARENKISLDDLSGGTFTISNGGIYGSLLSTPILNPPQSGILGMHKIEKRAVVVNDQILIRPMMYLALSYDHRVVDGKGAVTFLVKIKECLEDPTRMLLEI